jgi:flavoprotein
LVPDDDIYIVPYEISKGIVSRQTGRAQPIICDFCRTWQAGSGAGNISFQKDKRSLSSVGFLCCADLQCSSHARTKTQASLISRAQLREDITNERRVERLKIRLRQIIAELQLEPVS